MQNKKVQKISFFHRLDFQPLFQENEPMGSNKVQTQEDSGKSSLLLSVLIKLSSEFQHV